MGLFIIALIGLIGGVYCSIQLTSSDNECKHDRGSLLFAFSLFFSLFSVSVTSALQNMNKVPTALDVYREKTELKVYKTYKNDSIITKCDSVVVFKEKIN